jgi:hypothetical protein
MIIIDEPDQHISWEASFIVVAGTDKVLSSSGVSLKWLVVLNSDGLLGAQGALVEKLGVWTERLFGGGGVGLGELSEVEEAVDNCLVAFNETGGHIDQDLVGLSLEGDIEAEHVHPHVVLESGLSLDVEFVHLEVHAVIDESVHLELWVQMQTLLGIEVKENLNITFIIGFVIVL